MTAPSSIGNRSADSSLRAGGKAGGPDYVRQFAHPRVVTENTLRHGIPVE